MSLELAFKKTEEARRRSESVTSAQFHPHETRERNGGRRRAQDDGRQELSSFRPSAARARIQAGFPLSRE